MKIKFWGAAGDVTGSHHLLENKDAKLALDCGLFQGRRAEFYEKNNDFAFPPAEVDVMILSHAHIDHSGNIPNFVRQGFAGDIYCTHATQDLCRPMLLDSAYIQEKDAGFVNKRNHRQGKPSVEPLYKTPDADAALSQFVGIGYYRWREFLPGVAGKLLEAGHILGSAQIKLEIDTGASQPHRLVFSGDIGRGKRAILREPEIPGGADTLIMESTYGNRTSPPVENLRGELGALVNRVAERGGKIIIPAFSVGRTQEIVYQLNDLFNENAIPRIPIFVDSPLSANVTEVFRNHPECFNRETREILRDDKDVFGFKTLTYTQNVNESKALNTRPGPFVVISASGMCENGRILHHLRNSIEDSKNCILIVGFQAEHTLGRRIVERREKVRIFGEEHPLRAEVKVLNGFSAHADRDELRDYAFRVHARSGGRLKRIFLVHGEEEPQAALAEYLKETLKVQVFSPRRGDVFEL